MAHLSTRPLARITHDAFWAIPPPIVLASTPSSSNRWLSTTPSLAATIKKTRIKRQDPRDAYALRQAKARKDANLSRQAVLREQRVKELGDPIRGIATPFVRSFDTVVPQDPRAKTHDINLEALRTNPDQPPPSPTQAPDDAHLNHGIKAEELAKSLETSRLLTEPPVGDKLGSGSEDTKRARLEAQHRSAAEAVQRIVSLTSGSSEHRTKKNVERIVDTFGRHNTDQTLKPKAPAVAKHNLFVERPQPTPRAGLDTGSSEVQIGILTAKIRVLADRYEGENRNDKINKRNLRLLLHRRQKLLHYMEKKERGSQRWQHMLETLGLTPACWQGQIEVQ